MHDITSNTDVHIYQQNIKILGATMINGNIIFISNDRSEITTKYHQVSYLNIYSIVYKRLLEHKQISFVNSAQVFLTKVFYNSYQIYDIATQSIIYQVERYSTELIVCAAETLRQDKVLVGTSDKLVLIDIYTRKILGTAETQVSSLENTTSGLDEDQFLGFNMSDDDTLLVRLSVRGNDVRVLQKTLAHELRNFIAFDMSDYQQTRLSYGVRQSYGREVLYVSHGACLGQCSALLCFDVNQSAVHYVYPAVAPVLRVSTLCGYLLGEHGQYYDIIAFADAAGFLTVSVGGTEENYKRLLTVYTNMWVKNIVLQVEETDAAQPTIMLYRINPFLDTENKLIKAAVHDRLTIFVFGTTELVRAGRVLHQDGFSIIALRLSDLIGTLRADKLEVERSDNFSYADYQIAVDPNATDSASADTQISVSDPTYVTEDGEETEEAYAGSSHTPREPVANLMRDVFSDNLLTYLRLYEQKRTGKPASQQQPSAAPSQPPTVKAEVKKPEPRRASEKPAPTPGACYAVDHHAPDLQYVAQVEPQQPTNKTINTRDGAFIYILQVYKHIPTVLMTYGKFSCILETEPIQLVTLNSQKLLIVVLPDHTLVYDTNTNMTLKIIQNVNADNLCAIIQNSGRVHAVQNNQLIEAEPDTMLQQLFILSGCGIVNVFSGVWYQFGDAAAQARYLLSRDDCCINMVGDIIYLIHSGRVVLMQYHNTQKRYHAYQLINFNYLGQLIQTTAQLQVYLAKSQIPAHILSFCIGNINLATSREINRFISNVNQVRFIYQFTLIQQIMYVAIQEYRTYKNQELLCLCLNYLAQDFRADVQYLYLVRGYLLRLFETHKDISGFKSLIARLF